MNPIDDNLPNSPLKLLALCGSLRQQSCNRTALQAITLLAPDHVDIHIDDTIGQLPLFNPDLKPSLPSTVQTLKRSLVDAKGLIIASPEYAHGVTGVIKNALDWLVSGEEFIDMPVILINTSPRAHHAQDALKEIIKTMSGNIIESACVSIPLLGSHLDTNGLVNNSDMANALSEAMKAFCNAIHTID